MQFSHCAQYCAQYCTVYPDLKSWDPRGPMIWDKFSIFRTKLRHPDVIIHARVVGSRVDVVTLLDQMLRVARFSCRFFTVIEGNKAEKKN